MERWREQSISRLPRYILSFKHTSREHFTLYSEAHRRSQSTRSIMQNWNRTAFGNVSAVFLLMAERRKAQLFFEPSGLHEGRSTPAKYHRSLESCSLSVSSSRRSLRTSGFARGCPLAVSFCRQRPSAGSVLPQAVSFRRQCSFVDSRVHTHSIVLLLGSDQEDLHTQYSAVTRYKYSTQGRTDELRHKLTWPLSTCHSPSTRTPVTFHKIGNMAGPFFETVGLVSGGLGIIDACTSEPEAFGHEH